MSQRRAQPDRTRSPQGDHDIPWRSRFRTLRAHSAEARAHQCGSNFFGRAGREDVGRHAQSIHLIFRKEADHGAPSGGEDAEDLGEWLIERFPEVDCIYRADFGEVARLER